MNREDKFKLLIDHLEDTFQQNDLLKYIGTGNPNADILIIGKESSINDKESEQYRVELKGNFRSWKEKTDFNQEVVKTYKCITDYDPLYPYKGQKYSIDNGRNNGTSRTWYTYQKLINHIYDTVGNTDIDFHEYAFITEVNSKPSRKTKDADISSVELRKQELLKSEFIKSFPIVIISGVGYFNITSPYNEIVDIFDVKFKEKIFAQHKSVQPYWIHTGQKKSQTKLLINSYQLSIGIADKLLEEIADKIKEKIKPKN